MLISSKSAILALSMVFAGSLSPSSSIVNAAEINLAAKYHVSFLGINVGRMKHYIKISDKDYSISGGVKTNALVSLVANTKASFSGAGAISRDRLIPHVHKVSFKSGKKRGAIDMNFKSGNISNVSVIPKVKIKPDTVPVKKAHLKNVLDPVSSLLFPVATSDLGNGPAVCDRTLPVFDGKSRMNLVFSYKNSSRGKAKGFRGETFTCAVRYQPVSGIRPGKKNIKFMKANRKIEVTLARVGNSNFYGLFAFKVPTEKGTIAGRAYHFSIQ